jgi:hypothetical protein
MASNTLTAILPTLYEALDTVSREQIGMIGGVRRDTTVARAAKGQTVKSHVVPQNSAEDITAGQHPADSGEQTITAVDVSISKSRAYPIKWNGEEQLSLRNGDYPQLNTILRDQFAQGFRTLANEMETDLVTLYDKASRAYGTSGTTPFGTADELDDVAEVYRILVDNGSPTTDLQFVIGSAAAANMRGKQSSLFKVNEAGTENMLREGEIGRLQKFMFRESGQIDSGAHTAGTADSATTDDSGYAIGARNITLASAGTGTILEGDVITFAGDTNQYVVDTGDSDVSDGGTIVLEEPGLKKAIAASATAITVTAAYVPNMAFDRNAIVLAARLPALPEGGDEADDRTIMVDPVSGIPFEVAVYRQYRQVKIEIAAAWGFQAVKSEHLALLKG